MKKMFKKSKGFTLVELLIVVVIIGILAGMMMLSTGSATAKAEATKIVANMRNMKAAAIMVYSDANQWPSDPKSLDAYLDQKFTNAATGSELLKYKLETSGDFVSYTGVKSDVGASLVKMIGTGVPLLKDMTTSADYVAPASGGTNSVYMRVK